MWGYFLWAGVHEPLGGINQLFPVFGISNQLPAAVALAVCTTLLVKSGRLKWAWITGIPLAWAASSSSASSLALLIVVVLVDAARICVRHLRRPAHAVTADTRA